MSIYCFATWSLQIVPLILAVTIHRDLPLSLVPDSGSLEGVQLTPSHQTRRNLEPFAVFLSEVSQKSHQHNEESDKEFLNDERNAIFVGKDGSCYNRQRRCIKAGARAYYLTCNPRDHCGGDPQRKFLYYNCLNCRAAFPFDGDSRGSTCEHVRLNQPNISGRENGKLVLIVKDKTLGLKKVNDSTKFQDSAAVESLSPAVESLNPTVESLSPTVMTLSSCRISSRSKCQWACKNSYITLCSVDYQCPPDVLVDFEKNCYKGCRRYFD